MQPNLQTVLIYVTQITSWKAGNIPIHPLLTHFRPPTKGIDSDNMKRQDVSDHGDIYDEKAQNPSRMRCTLTPLGRTQG